MAHWSWEDPSYSYLAANNRGSCYQIVLSARNLNAQDLSPSLSGVVQVKWEHIWSLNIPPKVRMFMWRASMNILPVLVELFRRHIIPSPVCASCSEEMESLAHVFMECRGLRDIWGGPPFNLPYFDNHCSFWYIFQQLKKLLPHDLCLQALIVCWKSWDTCNKELHGGEMRWTPDLVSYAHEPRQF